jgi:hypothetical protein
VLTAGLPVQAFPCFLMFLQSCQNVSNKLIYYWEWKSSSGLLFDGSVNGFDGFTQKTQRSIDISLGNRPARMRICGIDIGLVCNLVAPINHEPKRGCCFADAAFVIEEGYALDHTRGAFSGISRLSF